MTTQDQWERMCCSGRVWMAARGICMYLPAQSFAFGPHCVSDADPILLRPSVRSSCTMGCAHIPSPGISPGITQGISPSHAVFISVHWSRKQAIATCRYRSVNMCEAKTTPVTM